MWPHRPTMRAPPIAPSSTLGSPVRTIHPSDRRGILDGGVAPPRNTAAFLVVAPCPRGAAAPGLGSVILTGLLITAGPSPSTTSRASPTSWAEIPRSEASSSDRGPASSRSARAPAATWRCSTRLGRPPPSRASSRARRCDARSARAAPGPASRTASRRTAAARGAAAGGVISRSAHTPSSPSTRITCSPSPLHGTSTRPVAGSREGPVSSVPSQLTRNVAGARSGR